MSTEHQWDDEEREDFPQLPDLADLELEFAREQQIRDQEVAEARDLGRAVGAYWQETIKANIPPPIAGALVREFQQAELHRRLNLDVLRERLGNE